MAMGRLVGLADVAVLLRRVLPLAWMYRLARLNGTLVYLLAPAKRRAVRGNLADFADGGAELRSMTRKYFQQRQTRILMLQMFLEMDPQERPSHLEIEGLEHLDQALAAGHGVILLASHLNSLGVLMTVMILRQRGYDVGLALPSENEPFAPTRLGRFLHGKTKRLTLREELGGFYVRFNVRPIVKRLARNAIVGQTGDGWHSAAFASVPFLGRSLPFTTGMMSVAQSTGAMVVPCNVVGTPPDLRCVIFPPYVVPKGDDPAADLAQAIGRFVETLERDLGENPLSWEHWLIPDTLDTMQSWPERPLNERLEL